MTLELSAHPAMPLDYSSGAVRVREDSGSPVNVSDSAPSSPPPVSSSAFRVVTPKGRDGKFKNDLCLFLMKMLLQSTVIFCRKLSKSSEKNYLHASRGLHFLSPENGEIFTIPNNLFDREV